MAFGWDDALFTVLGAVGSQGGGPQQTTTETVPWGPQAEQLQNLFSGAQGLYQAGVPLVPGASGATQEGERAVMQAARGFPATLAPAQQAQQFALGDVLSPESNPYLQQYMDMITKNIMQGVTEQALPAVRGEAIRTGGYGGSRQGIAEAQAIERGAAQAGTAASGMAGQAYGQGLQTMSQALGRTPQFAALEFLPAQQMLGVGGAQEQRQQQQAMDPWMQAQLYQGLIGGKFGGATTQTMPGPQGNPLLGAVGGYLTGNELFGDLFPKTPSIYGTGRQSDLEE